MPHALIALPSPKEPQPPVFPVYNHDQLHFTPAFLLPSERVKLVRFSTVPRPTFLPRRRSSVARCGLSVSRRSVWHSKFLNPFCRPPKAVSARFARTVSRITGPTCRAAAIRNVWPKTSTTKTSPSCATSSQQPLRCQPPSKLLRECLEGFERKKIEHFLPNRDLI
jgi:hypothetical protein